MKNSDGSSELLLKNQLCFPLYACARTVIARYKPHLDELALTYTQYVTMLVLWEHGELTSREIGRLLYLDSGTLTPLLKKLEARGLIERLRSEKDERNLTVRITDEGMALRERAKDIPDKVCACMPLSEDEQKQLYALLYKLLEN